MRTRSSNLAEDTALSFAKQMDDYITNSAVFKEAILKAFNVAVNEIIKPINEEIASLQCQVKMLKSAGVPQGSVLGPLLFLIYINDVTENLKSDCLLYADDTSLFDIVDDPATSSQKLNNDLSEIKDWARKWLVTINPSKTECMTFSAKRIKPPHPDLFYADNKIIEVAQHTHLGVVLCNNLSWRAHIFKIYEKASKRLNILKGIKYKVDRSTLRKLYKSLVRPLMEYADVLWDGCTDSESDLLEHVQYEAAKIVTGAMKGTSKQRLMQEIGWEDLKTRRAIHKLLLYFKIVNNLCPSYLVDLLPLLVSERTNYSLRTASNYSIFASRTERYKRSFFPSTTSLWNDIGYDIRCLDSIGSFKKALLSSYNVSNYNATFILLLIDLMQFSTLVYA